MTARKPYLCIIVLAIIIATISDSAAASPVSVEETEVRVGAARTEAYLPLLKGKRVGLLSNHTGMVGNRHTLDLLLDNSIDVRRIFSPEHGFRGTADAGEHVKGSIDKATGLEIVSLYGGARYPTAAQLNDIDVVVCDIQDVGLRFYTYYCTMLDMMKSAAGAGKEFMIFDRPNPNGMSVDGPLLDMHHASGVGRLPIPVLHGLTLGELARMAVGEGWLKGAESMQLTVIECEGYTHQTRYRLPIAPSPNLPDMKSVYLYPSTCYFEATPLSLGRGTAMPFCVYGHPDLKGKPGCDFAFTPRSLPGAKNPPQLGRVCYGRDLRSISDEEAIAQGVNLEYIIDAYRKMGRGSRLMTSFFEKLIGNNRVRRMIVEGASADEIKATWADDVARFREQRKPYLLYPE